MKPVFAGLFFLIGLVRVALTCTCALPTFEQQMKTASAVFTGRVLDSQHDGEQLRVRLEVEKRYQGPREKILVVRTAENTAACGYQFEKSRMYLVFASGEKNLEVSLCSRTKLVTEAKEDLDRLEVTATPPRTPARDPFTTMRGDRFQRPSIVPKELNITHAVLVGITKKSDGYVVLIRATNGKVYFLKAGDKLHDGVVQKIDQNSVTFRQNTGSGSKLVRKQLRPFSDQ